MSNNTVTPKKGTKLPPKAHGQHQDESGKFVIDEPAPEMSVGEERWFKGKDIPVTKKAARKQQSLSDKKVSDPDKKRAMMSEAGHPAKE
ncbi:hypothetical protein QOT17_016553 [Balamuthia mandrillaris]